MFDTRAVSRRIALWLVVASACYSPTLRSGSPCEDDRGCPTPLVCFAGTCQSPGEIGTSAPDASPVDSAADAAIDGAPADAIADAAPDCGGQPCEPNDQLAGAIDVTGGGTFTADLLRAHDDLANNGCNLDGGAEVFYQVELAAPEVYYFDTFTTTFDTSLRVFPGVPCLQVTSALEPACDDDECSSDQSQLAVALPIGQSCVAVDKNYNLGHQADQGVFQLHVVAGKRTGIALPRGVHMLTGDTCTGASTSEPPTAACSGPQHAKDLAYFFTACPATPATVDASTCDDVTMTHFDTELYAEAVDGTSLGCVDDTPSCPARPDRQDGQPDGSKLTVTTTATGLHWLVIDGFRGACGGYQLDTNYR